MNTQPVQLGGRNRASLVRHGRRLEYFTIAYNSLEGLIALVAGLMAGSIALVGFGFDSLIEVTSGAALVWRLHLDADESRREILGHGARIDGGRFRAMAAMAARRRREPVALRGIE